MGVNFRLQFELNRADTMLLIDSLKSCKNKIHFKDFQNHNKVFIQVGIYIG